MRTIIASSLGTQITQLASQAQEREKGYILEDLKNGIEQSMCYMYYLAYNSKKWW